MNEAELSPAELSIVVAVYNETSYNLQTLVERLAKALAPSNLVYEIVFVNDGSKEDTCACLKELVQRLDYVKLVNLSRNFGQQAAISAGINFAVGKSIVTMDSDLQDPPELIPDMVQLWRRGYDVIYAKRSSRKDRLAKRLSAHIYYRMMSFLSSIEIPRDTGEFRLIDRRVADCLKQLPERTRYIRGLIPWLGFKQTTIPVDRHARQHGESGYNLRKLITLAVDGIVYFSHAPLHAMLLTGIGTMLASLIALALWLTLWRHYILVAVIVSGFVFLIGMQFLLLGILGLYIAKIFDEVRGRPVYVVSELIGHGFGDFNEKKRSKESQASERNSVQSVEHIFDVSSLSFGYQRQRPDLIMGPEPDQDS